MKKRILSMLLAVVFILSCIPLVAVSAEEAAEKISFSSATFTAYKGWKDADAGGQTRYEQRSNELPLQEGTLSNFVSGTEAKALSYEAFNYYPKLYLDASGALVNDERYDGKNEDVDLDTYLAEGYGKYYGVFKLGFSSTVDLDTFTIYNKNNDWHQNEAFDVLVSLNGKAWTVVKSFTGMTTDSAWDGETNGILYKNVDMGGVSAKYIAVAITKYAVKGQCALWYAEATGSQVVTEAANFSSISFTGYKGWMTANDGQDRYLQRSNALPLQVDGLSNIKSGTPSDTRSYSTSNYYPKIYLDNEGKLVNDKRYDNVNQSVDLNTYLAEGYGKYYGYFKFEFAEIINLETFTFYNRQDWGHLSLGFDILVSENGENWTKMASYSNLGTHENWDSGTNYVTVGGQKCLYVSVEMGGTEAKYVAVAYTAPDGKDKQCIMWYAEATQRVVEEVTEVTVSTVEELQDAIALGNTKTDFTIKLGSDIVCAEDTSFGVLTGTGLTIDGQGHTIYNFRKSFSNVEGAGITVKDIIFSNKTSENGEEFASGGKLFVWVNGTSATAPVTFENIVNERNATNLGAAFGMFTEGVAGSVVFRNCTNKGDVLSNNSGNWKIGGFVSQVQANAVLTFESCANMGDIRGSQAGGFVGIYQAGAKITMIDCVNSGTITACANGNAHGMAGGMIGSINNAGDVSSDTNISLTGCKNTGDILLDSTASNTKANALGGLIGHLGNVPNTTTKYEVIIDNCAVYDCTIDAIDSDNSHGSFYAAGFVGKISPQSSSNVNVVAKNSYLSKLSISAANARKFVGVGSHTVNVVTAENCMVYELVEVNANNEIVEWNASAMAGCTRKFSADSNTKTGFADTDKDDIISGGGIGALQTDMATGSTDIRFIATLPEGLELENYEKVGFYIVALTSENTDGFTNRVWIKNMNSVYSSILAAGDVTTAADICSGAQYLYLSEIEGITQLIGDVTFYVTPYIIAKDGSIVYGQSYSHTVKTGVPSDAPISVMSYNLKDGDYNGESAQSRKSDLADVVKTQNAGIVCLQELGTANDLYHFTADSFVSSCGSDYAYHQAGTTAVMWDTTVYTALDTGSVDCTVADGGDGYTRECAWVKLQRIEDGAIFYVVSAHLDMNKPADSAAALINYFNGETRVIVAGDLNADETRKSVQNAFASASYTNANVDFTNALADNASLQDNWDHNEDGYPADYGLTATFSSNGTILDWCYAKGGFTVNEFEVLITAGTDASDHYPICAELILK